MYVQGSPEFKHHVETYGPQSKFGYKDFIPMFTARHFDAARWARLFKKAGARYVVPVAEHHDGFAMYDCGFSKWTAAKMGPKRDLIGELVAAVRKEGMTLGLSNHRIEHWYFMDEGRKFDSDIRSGKWEDFYGPAQPKDSPMDPPHGPKWLDEWLVRCCEMVDKYQPELFYFDWWINYHMAKAHLRRFAAYYYNWAAANLPTCGGVVLNYKDDAFPPGAAVLDFERGLSADVRAMPWQTDTAVGKNSWGYIHNMDYKTSGEIIADLVDIVSKNGNLLLNIGPRAGRHDSAPGRADPAGDRQVACRQRRGDLRHAAVAYLRRRTRRGGRRHVQRGRTQAIYRRGLPLHHARLKHAICNRPGKAWAQIVIHSLGANVKLLTVQIKNVEMLGAVAPSNGSGTAARFASSSPLACRASMA